MPGKWFPMIQIVGTADWIVDIISNDLMIVSGECLESCCSAQNLLNNEGFLGK